MVWGRWERRKRNHLWKDDTLKSIKILISMILSIIYSSCFSLLCSFMYLFTVFTSPAREGDRQRFGQITFKLRVATMSVLQTLATWRRPFIVYCVTSALKIVLAKVKAGAWSFKLKRVLQACVGPRHSDICPRHPSCIPTYLAQLRGQKQYAIEIDVADAFVFRRMPIQCKGWSR